MNILHISDVHFGVKDPTGEQGRVAEALVTAVHREALTPNLCIFSGDLAHAGLKSEFITGQDWLSRLILPEWNASIAIVPGNHDIVRSSANRTMLRACADELLYPSMRDAIQSSNPQATHFFDFYKNAKTVLPIIGDCDANYFGYVHTLDVNHPSNTTGLPVHIIGLNSTILSCDDDDVPEDNTKDSNLIIDSKTLNEHLHYCNRIPGLIIAISHHPVHNLRKWNSGQIETYLSQQTGAHMYFYGHLHEQSTSYTATNTGRRLTKVAGGAAYQGSKWPQLFSYLTLNFEDQSITTKAYHYSLESGAWLPDPSRSWTFRAELPSPPPTTGFKHQKSAPQEEAEAESAADATQDDTVLNFTKAASEIQSRLLPYLQSAPEIKRYQYAFKNRIKTVDRIEEKVDSRKEARKSDYSYSDLVDICGFRIITHYQSQIVKVITNMLYSIYSNGSLGDVTVNKDSVSIDVNTSRPEDDPLSITRTIRDIAYASGLNVPVERKSRQTGYSSVHFIFKVVFNPPYLDIIDEMPVEIQVRTGLEDVWAELDTQLRFLSRRGELGPTWSKHLNVFKHVVDSLVQYADVIQLHSFDQPMTPPSELKRSRTVASAESQLERIKGLPQHIYKRVEEAYLLLEKANIARIRGGDPALRREAAQAFISISIDFAGNISDDRHLESELNYLIEAESAFMLMYTGNQDDMLAAENSYLSILGKRKNDATANYRLGSLYRLQNLYDKSLTYLSTALDILRNGKDTRVTKSHWIYDRVRLGIALTEWSRSRARNVTQSFKEECLVAALQMAVDVARNPSEEQAIDNLYIVSINDLLYYYYELNEIKYSDIKKLVTKSEISEYVESLYTFVTSCADCEYNLLDTTLRHVSNNKDRAIAIALKLEQKFEDMATFRKKSADGVPKKGSSRWKLFVSRELKDDDEEEALGYCLEVIERLGRPTPS